MDYIDCVREKYGVLNEKQHAIDLVALLIFASGSRFGSSFEAAELVLGRRIDSKETDVAHLWFLQDPATALANLQARRAQEAMRHPRERRATK